MAKDQLMKIEIPTDKISSRERYLEAIVQSAIDYAIISMDLDGLVTSWNEGARRVLGWDADEMVGRPATAFFTLEDREQGPGEEDGEERDGDGREGGAQRTTISVHSSTQRSRFSSISSAGRPSGSSGTSACSTNSRSTASSRS